MFECRTFITVKEIGEVLGVSESKSYGIVRDLNKDLVMRDITPRDVLTWQNEMRKMESKEGNNFKGTYLRKMQAELSAIFNHAVKYYELPKNSAVIAGPLGQHHADEMLF